MRDADGHESIYFLAAIGPGFTAGTYVATITAESVNITKAKTVKKY